MKRLGQLALLIGLLTLGVKAASAAVPVIDGTITGTEWDTFVLSGSDVNEGGISDAYDISGIKLITDDDGGADDGLYILLTSYAAPSLVDTGVGFPPASIGFNLNYNGDGDFLDATDLLINHTALADGTGQTMTVRSGTGVLLFTGVEGTNFKLGSVAEYFIPKSVIGSVSPLPGSLLGEANYDNGGNESDDRLPDSGFFTPIPEPTSMVLLGLGLLGGIGSRKRLFGL